MRILIALLLATLASTAVLHAKVVRAMPDFSWVDSTGKTKSSKDLRGRPLVILIADSPTEWAFRSQVGQLQKIYQRFAADGLVCIAVPDGTAAAAAFDTAQGFSISIIGMDGNLDYVSNRVVAAQRIHDIIDNSYAKQKLLRRD